MQINTLIIGGGLSGLTAANQLHKNGMDFLLLEASNRVGGRVKTDIVNGYRLDYGFQVLLTAYPQAKHWLDYEALQLKSFLPGAQLLYPDGSQGMLGDPLRNISSLFPTIFNKSGTLKDKVNILKLRNRLSKLSIQSIFEQEEIPTSAVLRSVYGFSDQMVQEFFEPFFTGIFLEKELSTSRRMFDFVFKMFSEGNTAIPNLGMEEIPKQLSNSLPEKSIITKAEVIRIEGQTVFLKDGSSYSAQNIIVATEAIGLIKELSNVKKKYQSTTHVHFTSEVAPVAKPIIALNTKRDRLANNICTINKIAPGYSENQDALISLSIVGQHGLSEKELIQQIRNEMQTWFGNETEKWEHLHTRTVHYGLPNQQNVTNNISSEKYLIRKGLYVCGDHLLNGSIHAAMLTGQKVAELIVRNN